MADFNKLSREDQLKLIRQFLASDEANGGIMLVSGPRGVGKSRLVDEAVSTQEESEPLVGWQKNSQYPILKTLIEKIPKILRNYQRWPVDIFGVCSRVRARLRRGPRSSNRLLIKVNVDPFFPHRHRNSPHDVPTNKASQTSQNDKETISDDESSALALSLLRNIVFALTSIIDPRLSWRRHGRTLLRRLGFWRYLFSATGFSGAPGVYWAVLGFWLIVSSSYWLELMRLIWSTLNQWSVDDFFWYLIWLPLAGFSSIGVSLMVALSPFWILRMFDWWGLVMISRELYDLSHAQEMNQTNSELAMKFDAAIHPSAPVNINSWAFLVAGIGLDMLYNINHEVLPFAEMLPARLFTLLGIAGFCLSAWLNYRSRFYIARFGNKNPAWIITLLRRYLYLAHRCGLEPVLVFDELDKLETKPLKDERAKSESSEENSENFDKDKWTLGERGDLKRFLYALLRLRDSSGAGFLIVLITGPTLHHWLRAQRRESLSTETTMHPTGTLITQELNIGPISPNAAQAYAEHKDFNDDNVWIAYAYWFQARGLYANYQRLLERYRAEELEPGVDAKSVKELFQIIQKNGFWELEESFQECFIFQQGSILSLQESSWNQSFVNLGMLQFCHDLLIPNGNLTDILRVDEFLNERGEDPNRVLIAHPDDLIRIGRFAMQQRLGRDGKLETVGEPPRYRLSQTIDDDSPANQTSP